LATGTRSCTARSLGSTGHRRDISCHDRSDVPDLGKGGYHR
jgi:hypothetical protein